MLQLDVKAREFFDERTNEFILVKPATLQLEHSLISISKWESKWKKPFLSSEEKSMEETLDYIRCMTISQNVDPYIYLTLSADDFRKVNEYIGDKMTATWFNEKQQYQGRKETVTSELIYYWMIAYSIPSEYQKWHLNRLMTLIRICSIKSQPPKKRSKRDILKSNAQLNAERRQKYNTKG